MSQYHGIPEVSVVSFLLFLCFTRSGLGENCLFPYEPLPTTTNVSSITEGLDELCSELWQLHFIFRELSRMRLMAGSELREKIEDFKSQLNLKELFEDCKLESGCVDFERTNISVFLDSVSSNFEAMIAKMETSLNFSSCAPIRCQPNSLSTPFPGYGAQVLGNTQASKSAILRRHHWLLIPIFLLVCLFSALKLSGKVPLQPLPLQV